jgi:two-component sensor histidine kinase
MDASSSMPQFVAALDGRIRSMALTHELLSGSPLGKAFPCGNFSSVTCTLCDRKAIPI